VDQPQIPLAAYIQTIPENVVHFKITQVLKAKV
jgi:hypothetical protein